MIIEHFAYSFLLFLAVIGIAAIWRFAHIKLQPKGLLAAFAAVSSVFLLWDVWATLQGHWFFAARFTLGIKIGPLPLEEVLFFVVIPAVCIMLYLWLATLRQLQAPLMRTTTVYRLQIIMIAVGIAAATVLWQRTYSRTVFLGLALSMIAALVVRQKLTKAWWLWQLVIIWLFLLANTYLTALPIVTYGESAIIGLRIGTIPIEDLVYNFVLLSSSLLVYRLCTPETRNDV